MISNSPPSLFCPKFSGWGRSGEKKGGSAFHPAFVEGNKRVRLWTTPLPVTMSYQMENRDAFHVGISWLILQVWTLRRPPFVFCPYLFSSVLVEVVFCLRGWVSHLFVFGALAV